MTVTVNYYNREKNDMKAETYGFREYTELLKQELIQILINVEDAFYRFNDERPPEEWDEKSVKEYAHIRRKILDQANAILRLPQTMKYRGYPVGSIGFSELLAKAIDGDDDLK